MLPAMAHRTFSARDVPYLREGPLESSPSGTCLTVLLLIVVNKDWLAAAAVRGGRRHTHNRRTQHNNRSKCGTHLLRYN
jgi:hypothetical protein